MIERSPHRERFTRIDNRTLEDERLSWGARGLLAYLLSRPDRWRIDRHQLASVARNGERAAWALLRELEQAGYLTRERGRGERGRLIWTHVVHEVPSTSVQEPHSGERPTSVQEPHSGATSDNAAKPQVGSSVQKTTVRKPPPLVTTERETTEPTTESRLCDLLADEIARNTGRRPKVGKRWLDAARLLLDRDKRTAEQVAYLIRWSQASEFWRANILSMSKLREKWDTLALQAKAQHNGRRGAAGASGAAAPVDRDAALRLAAEQNEQERARLAAARTTQGATP